MQANIENLPELCALIAVPASLPFLAFWGEITTAYG